LGAAIAQAANTQVAEEPGVTGPAGESPVAPKPAGTMEGRFHSYLDDNRLTVTSGAAAIEHPFTAALSMTLRAVADWIAIGAPPAKSSAVDPHAGHDGHVDHIDEYDNPTYLDAVSGASARVGATVSDTKELRSEGALGLAYRRSVGGRPALVSGEARVSHEPDYLSIGGTLLGRIDLAQSNATLTAFVGLGRDEISPEREPAGQEGMWPAEQIKTSAGFSLSQILTPSLVVSGGASGALQTSRLSSPYRNYLVGITYFPENLPDRRLRATAFAQASWHLGWGAALHSRQGFYGDDWGVTAWIPEAALAKELGPLLVTAKHRFYAQSRADFYRTSYPDRKGFQTGDLRLGKLYDQTGALEAEYRIVRGSAGSGPVVLSGEYSFSRLEYPDLHPRILRSHVFSIGIRSGY
jgi:hypothetical protein